MTSPSPHAPPLRWRDRIKELRRVRAADLVPHPLNWREHPPAQRAALEALLGEIGFADALLARELPDGRLQLIDGHLRAETAPEMHVPVLILDLDEVEAEKLLATLDPLALLAEANAQAIAALQARISTESAEIAALLENTHHAAIPKNDLAEHETPLAPSTPALALEHLFQILVECDDEAAQKGLYERLTEEGFRCRALVL